MKKLFSIFLALTLSAGLWAQETQTVSYLYPVYKTPDDPASGIKEWQTGTVDATVVTGSDEEVAWNAGWYVVTGADVMFQNGISCHGEVHLILADGAKLTADSYFGGQPSELNSSAIKVHNFLAVYGQADQSGQLCANGISEHAGIYCLEGSSIIINGGKVTATGENAAGIGGESATDFDIIINGGTVTATSMSSIEHFGNMEGIYISDIIINGGTITANGGKKAAGIGCGFPGTYNITINGGTITANGGKEAAGIGISASGIAVTSNITINININGGTVTAYGGENAASIGDAYNVSGSNITINGGTITAIGGKNGNAIGNGKYEYGSTVVKVATTLIVKADNSNPPTTVIANDRTNATNIAADFRGRQYATIESKPPFAVSYGENITVSPTFTSGAEIVSGTQITFTAADRTATGYAFVGFYKESTFVNQITEGVSGRTYTATVTDAAISVYAKYEMIKQVVTYGDNITVSPEFASGEEMSWGTGITFTAADRAADNCEFLGFYKDSAFENPITGGVSGRTYTATVNDAAISVYAKYRQYFSSTYIDENGQEQTADNAIEITNSSSTLSAGWYIVTGDNVSTGSLTCNGAVHLILADGAKLTATGDGNRYTPGICVSGNGNSITIYGQSLQSGQLIATGGNYAAGIGGGNGQTGSNITIYGGEITASGGFFGDGIGSGYNGPSASNIKVATRLLVKAGDSQNPTTVIANTGADLAGKLAGKRYVTVGAPKHAVTYGDYITVSPQFASGDNVACGTTITFTAADRSADGYEFVGFYKESTFDTPITTGVSGQTCTATVTDAAISVYAKYEQTVSVSYIDAAGQGQTTDAVVVTNSASQATWTAGWYVVNGSNVTLSKGAVCNGAVNLILADGAKLTATGVTDGLSQAFTPGILVSGTGNSLAIYGQSAQSGQLIANGGSSSAGIGGGGLEDKEASNITINGGVITANGNYGAAGIGGGNGGDGSNITVNGGTVTANGGQYASAIGGGWQADGSNITVNGGTVTANGGTDASGIGGGYEGSGDNIKVATNFLVKADGNNPPTTEVAPAHTSSTDIADDLAGRRYATIKLKPTFTVTYGDNITVSPDFESGANIFYGTEITFTAVVPSGYDYDFLGFYKESTFKTQITEGVSGQTYTATVTDAAISVYARFYDGNPIPVTSSSTAVTWGTAGTTSLYIVTGDVQLSQGAVCNGHVRLILADDAKLTVNGGKDAAGITVSGGGNSLTVFGQTNQTGQLEAKGGENAAGIGGGNEQSGSDITINGGIVTATGGLFAAGIGGGFRGEGSDITINGGIVTAKGGQAGAGIGGGEYYSGFDITINGGIVTATGDAYGAGIGGGSDSSGSNITINGGTVMATGGQWGDGIGGESGYGDESSNIFVAADLIVKAGSNPPGSEIAPEHTSSTDIANDLADKHYAYITPRDVPTSVSYIDENGIEQTIDANAVIYSAILVTWGTAGTTTWYVVNDADMQLVCGAACNGDVRLILADGAKLTATGANAPGIQVSGDGNSLTIYGQTAQTGQLFASGGDLAAGIGGGQNGSGSNIIINGGVVTATGNNYSAGIGGGQNGSGSNITINGGVVTATGNNYSAGIGGGYRGNGSNITINGGIVAATGGDGGAGIGGGEAQSGSEITVVGGEVTATGGDGGAGIGGGRGQYGSDIIIKGGTVTATGGNGAASIGGGQNGNGSNITIDDGTVTAVAGKESAGIGGGQYGSGSVITINGGVVTATGNNYGAGIGGGRERSGSDITIEGGTVTATGGNLAAGIGGGDNGPGSNITINGGEVKANGGENAAGIGGGRYGSSSNIFVAASLTVYADKTDPPTIEIPRIDNDIAPYIAVLQYVMVKNDATGAKESAIAEIYAAIEGVTNADIIAIATNAVAAINAATTLYEIGIIKEQALAAIASAKAAYAEGYQQGKEDGFEEGYEEGKAEALGEMGTPCEDCPAVEVTKGTTTVKLYNPEGVTFKKTE